jgi:uncharacterized protein (DUF433 family)
MHLADRITTNPDICHVKNCIRELNLRRKLSYVNAS